MENLTMPVPSQPISDEPAPWLKIRVDQIRLIAGYVVDAPDDTSLQLTVRGQGYFYVDWQDTAGNYHHRPVFPELAPGD
jgi:hypothetical protein